MVRVRRWYVKMVCEGVREVRIVMMVCVRVVTM